MIFNKYNDFTEPEHEAMMSVWFSGVILKRISRAFFRDRIVSEAQFNALMALQYAEKEVSQQDLSNKLLVDKSNITSIVDGLEKLEFVQRVRNSNDRRTYKIELTKKALDFLADIEKDYRDLISRVLADFTDNDIKNIIAIMIKFQHGLEKEEARNEK